MLCKRTSWSPSHALQNGIVEPLTSLRGTCRSPSLRAIVVHHLYEPLIGSPSLCCAVFVRRSTLSGTQGRRWVAVPAAEEFAVPPSLRGTSRSPSLRAIVHRRLYEPLVVSPSLCCAFFVRDDQRHRGARPWEARTEFRFSRTTNVEPWAEGACHRLPREVTDATTSVTKGRGHGKFIHNKYFQTTTVEPLADVNCDVDSLLNRTIV